MSSPFTCDQLDEIEENLNSGDTKLDLEIEDIRRLLRTIEGRLFDWCQFHPDSVILYSTPITREEFDRYLPKKHEA